MPTLGFSSYDKALICEGQIAGLTKFEGVSLIVLGLHNATDATSPEEVKAERFTLLTPERAREMALTLFGLADECQKRNVQRQEDF